MVTRMKLLPIRPSPAARVCVVCAYEHSSGRRRRANAIVLRALITLLLPSCSSDTVPSMDGSGSSSSETTAMNPTDNCGDAQGSDAGSTGVTTSGEVSGTATGTGTTTTTSGANDESTGNADMSSGDEPREIVTIEGPRTRVSMNEGWKFLRGDVPGSSGLSYEEAKAWVLPTGNAFLRDPAEHAVRPEGNLGDGLSYLANDFDDETWQTVDLPHDYAIEGPYTDDISSNMGRLPSPGVAWYRKTWTVSAEEADRSVFLDIDGAMSYSMVWLNGQFIGGWPYGYTSYRLDLSEHVRPGEENVLAIRIDNPQPADAEWDSGSSRWYPGAGIYRNVWLVGANPVHVAQWGTHITTPEVSESAASVSLQVAVDNDGSADRTVEVGAEIYEMTPDGELLGPPAVVLEPTTLAIPAGSSATAVLGGVIENPRRWGVPPTQTPNRYQAVTRVTADGESLDVTTTTFGVRTLAFDGEGFVLNGERLKLKGVCLHHDLGALGAAFNERGRERQLQIMAEMGSNALRTAHNPFEPEFYELADRLGFLVMDEAFDVWAEGKAALDHHVFFEEWHEQDLRALIRRDRNHPSVFMWSIGNEVIEQYDRVDGPAWAERLTAISHEEDPTRPTVAGMNAAEPDDPFSGPIDTIGLNYQGTGVRDRGAQYPTYHDAFPDKFIVGTETTSTFSTRGTYLFPVTPEVGAPAMGINAVDNRGFISSYDLYHADWSYSPDEEFASQDRWPYVGGEFVWTGFDYLGEPTPLDGVARSSYFGIVDLAGFKKDRFYLYQAYWRPDEPMVHILPHWTWPNRVGQTTPVHVYTSGDEAELFLNGVSQGRRCKGQYQYRMRWDEVVYEPGELTVVAYKGGREWARQTVTTVGDASHLMLSSDQATLAADGEGLAFVTLSVVDAAGRMVPAAMHPIHFEVAGEGELVATDNGSPVDRNVFSSADREAFNGMALAIVRARSGTGGAITVTASSPGLADGTVTIAVE